jgi:hypothetical protein
MGDGVAGDAVSEGWSARAKSPALANRSAATGARARWIAWSIVSGTLGRTRRTLGTGSVSRFAIMACTVGPV